MGQLKQLDPHGPVNAIVAHLTDAGPQLEEHRAWFTEHHVDGEAFAVALTGSATKVLEQAAKVVLERAEALDATAVQNEELKRGIELVRYVRNFGRYAASELEVSEDPELRKQARPVLTACGVGQKVNLNRQSGLRRLLMLQREGVQQVATVLERFGAQADLLKRLDGALAAIEAAIQDQAREHLEAQLAADELDFLAGEAIAQFNRAVRLLNAHGASPERLVAALSTLQSEHTIVLALLPPERCGARW